MTTEEVIETLKQAIDFIESQQAKINKSEKARQKQAYLLCNLRGQKYELMNRMPRVKNEAYKEFAETLKLHKRRMRGFDLNEEFWDYAVLVECIDNLLKELVGDNK